MIRKKIQMGQWMKVDGVYELVDVNNLISLCEKKLEIICMLGDHRGHIVDF